MLKKDLKVAGIKCNMGKVMEFLDERVSRADISCVINVQSSHAQTSLHTSTVNQVVCISLAHWSGQLMLLPFVHLSIHLSVCSSVSFSYVQQLLPNCDTD